MNENLQHEKSERMLEIFFRALRGEKISASSLAKEYGVSTRSINRDIADIQSFLSNHSELMHNSELVWSNREKSYHLNNNELLKNKELFALVEVILGCRCFQKDEVLNLIYKLKRFTTIQDRAGFEKLIRKEVYHYHEVKSDCNTVIDNLWTLINAIEKKNILTITYFKMNREKVKRKIKPVSVIFSEYYFYLIAYMADDDNYNAKFFRVDRITNIIENRETFSIPYEYEFDEGELREKNQFMFPGKIKKICFEFSGLSVQAVLDRLPTAKIVEKNGNSSVIEAEVNLGRGIIMYLLSQGSWVKVLYPPELVDGMKTELEKMLSMYG